MKEGLKTHIAAQSAPDEREAELIAALEHIAKTCNRSRTSTRRLRWIEQRAKWAIEGKPYDRNSFDLPKEVGNTAHRLSLEVARLKAELDELQRAQSAPAVAGMDGWRWVPVEPTPELYGRYLGRELMNMDRKPFDSWANEYRRIIAAAPAQPAAQVDEREAFEGWLSSLKFVSGQGQAHVEYCLHRDLSDKYTTEWVSDMYRGFQAGAAWQRTQASPAPSADGGEVESDEVRRLREAIAGADDVLAALTACTTPLVRLERKYGKDWDRAIDSVRTELIAALSAHRGEGERQPQQLVECDNCPTSGGCVSVCMRAKPSAGGDHEQ